MTCTHAVILQDYATQRGLLTILGQRKSLLKYLYNTDK